MVLSTNLYSVAGIVPPTGVGTESNIILWLRPDTGVLNSSLTPATIGQDVAQWLDISGNGFNFTNNFTARRPVLDTLNGQKYLNFTPGDFFENIAIKDSINGLTEFSIFITIKSDVIGTDQGFLDSEDPNNTDDKICLRYDKKDGAKNNCIKAGLSGNTANNQVSTSSYTQSTSLQVITLAWKQGEKLKLYLNGALKDSSNSAVTSAISSVSKIIVGKGPKDNGGGLGGASGWDGLIGELLFYNKRYSADTISIVASKFSSIETAQSGNWNSPTTWDCQCVPDTGINVTILSGHTVTLDSIASAKSLNVKIGGVLDFSSSNFEMNIAENFTVDGSIVERQSQVNIIGTVNSFVTGTFSLTI